MKPKDIKFSIDIKDHKAPLYLKVFLLDAVSSFEKKHPRIVPRLLEYLQKGDAREILKYSKFLKELANDFSSKVAQFDDYANNYLSHHLERIEDGKSFDYVSPEGDVKYSARPGEAIELGGTKEKKKKAPAKKRATKKKTKKEE